LGSGRGPLPSMGGGCRWGGMAVSCPAGRGSAALLHGPVMSPAQQGQIRQIGGATIQPVPEMVALAPGQGPVTVGEDPAAVADREGAALGGVTTRLARPRSRGWPGAPPRLGGSTVRAARSRSASPSSARVEGRRSRLAAGLGLVSGGTADQDPGQGPVTGQPPTPLGGQGPTPPPSPPARHRPASCPGRPPHCVGGGPAARGSWPPPGPPGQLDRASARR
jgi:hypothetical protein